MNVVVESAARKRAGLRTSPSGTWSWSAGEKETGVLGRWQGVTGGGRGPGAGQAWGGPLLLTPPPKETDGSWPRKGREAAGASKSANVYQESVRQVCTPPAVLGSRHQPPPMWERGKGRGTPMVHMPPLDPRQERPHATLQSGPARTCLVWLPSRPVEEAKEAQKDPIWGGGGTGQAGQLRTRRRGTKNLTQFGNQGLWVLLPVDQG